MRVFFKVFPRDWMLGIAGFLSRPGFSTGRRYFELSIGFGPFLVVLQNRDG